MITFYKVILTKLYFFCTKKIEKIQKIAKSNRSMKFFFCMLHKQSKNKTDERKKTRQKKGTGISDQ